MRFIFQLLTCLVLCGSTASAQLLAVVLKDSVSPKEYKGSMVKFRGTWVLMGEGKLHLGYNAETGVLNYAPNENNELFVFDPKKPGKSAYKIKKGEKVAAGKKNVLRIRGADIARVFVVDANQTLPGLAAEYRVTEAHIVELRKHYKVQERKSEERFSAGHRLVSALLAQESWLHHFGFSGELRKVRKEIEKERKACLEGSRSRKAKADQDSVQLIDTPEMLEELSQDEYKGKQVFHAARSNHFRLYYLVKGNGRDRQHMSDEQALDCLHFAEEVLDGFRSQYVDPYIGEDFEDTIPDGLLATWYFGHEDLKKHDAFAEALFGFKPGGNLKDEDRASGTYGKMGSPERTVFFWRMFPMNFKGAISHQLGHILGEFHYGSNEGRVHQAWIEEALGNSLAVKHVGHVSATCVGFKDNSYLKTAAKKGGKSTEGIGRRGMYDFIALSQAGPIRAVALKDLADMGDADLAKGWSFFYYLIETEGKAGQLYLRAAAKFSRERETLVEKWRQAAAIIFGVSDREALSGVESRWREYVTNSLGGGK